MIRAKHKVQLSLMEISFVFSQTEVHFDQMMPLEEMSEDDQSHYNSSRGGYKWVYQISFQLIQ